MSRLYGIREDSMQVVDAALCALSECSDSDVRAAATAVLSWTEQDMDRRMRASVVFLLVGPPERTLHLTIISSMMTMDAGALERAATMLTITAGATRSPALLMVARIVSVMGWEARHGLYDA